VALNERIEAHVGANGNVTDRISHEVKARSRRLLVDIKYYRTEIANSLKEIRQDFNQLRDEWNSQQATWQNKAGREMDEVNDSVRLVEERVARLVEDRVTEIQAAAKNSIQKVNTEIKNLREQLAAREVTDGAIPNQVLPVMVGDIENSIQSILDSANNAGNYHVDNGDANNLLRPCVATLHHNQALTALQNLLL